MSSRGLYTPKQISSQERPTIDLKQKNIKMGLFFNQKVGTEESKSKINWVRASHRNNVATTVRPIVNFSTPPKIYYSAKRAISGYLKPDNRTLNKILKFNNPHRWAQSPKSSLPSEHSFDVRSSRSKIHTQTSFSGNGTLTQSFLGRNIEVKDVRKELENKFQRTRLILKEEGKMQRYQKIQRIYEKKNKPLKYSIKALQDRQKDFHHCSPWQKASMQKCYTQEDEILSKDNVDNM